ncbi:sn-glycerol-3-phosphate ABC transporter ATP-binding protein UgpC [Mesorhizobium sp. NBSH29]|uniref:ABC transporter ATP-binding protein n=1 Tax=Mesorhizobium sp. NBSH29 TaxID=2654249 RepID=UPI0018965B15|nr:ABC transporter ATP-binding protein [Mesorhizobium sp. NBSH29]QPC86263.1 sn-glycerol-3-phosphate ABC transporter ATP-binding protein UgpC [Mesorhizobium sp. NBSH29]
MADLSLKSIKKAYGSLTILHGIDLEIKSGEFIVFVGPSGCGKSTLLRTIAGLEEISSGTLDIAGETVNDVPPSRRGIAMVFQSYALYPHMTVYDNMAFGMKIARAPKEEIDRRVRQAAEILQLTNYLDRLPKAMSGGQRQRVAIGRAIVRNPKVFLFDEPLSNLDAALRVATRIEIAKLKESMPDTTMIYVTHDQVEAMTLADRIVVLKDGRIEQVGSPMELYKRPGNLFVAQFIGSPAMNILPAKIINSGASTEVTHSGGNRLRVPISTPSDAAGNAISFGVRPEDLYVAKGKDCLFEGKVDYIEQLGEVQLVYVDIGRGLEEPLIAKLPGNATIKRGTPIKLDADANDLHIFNADGRSFAAGQQTAKAA